MYTVHNPWGIVSFFFLLQLVLCLAQHNCQADVIKRCVNSTNSASCSLNYEQVYKHLTKSENSLNISFALYPEGAKPSFLVRVNVYGPNKTHCSTPAMFTWSTHCLYANVPAWLLQILSLGSIIVSSRSQELNIQIPEFCCNISDDKEKREEMISGFLTKALYELQDLAIIPTVRDPSVNTAECVVQGHKPDFATAGRSVYIRVMLWFSLAFAMCSGLVLAVYWDILGDLSQTSNNRRMKNTAKAICFSFYLLSLLSILVNLVAFGFSIYYWVCHQYRFFDITLIFIVFIGFSVLEFFCICGLCVEELGSRIFHLWGANGISYNFWWLIVGIRINPTWGLTVALCVLSFFAAVTYAKYLYEKIIHSNGHSNGTNRTNGQNNGTINSNVQVSKTKTIFLCVTGCLAVVLFFVIVILAGHSHSGKEMAVDEVLKAISLYFLTAFISWVVWKRPTSALNPPGGRSSEDQELQTML